MEHRKQRRQVDRRRPEGGQHSGPEQRSATNMVTVPAPDGPIIDGDLVVHQRGFHVTERRNHDTRRHQPAVLSGIRTFAYFGSAGLVQVVAVVAATWNVVTVLCSRFQLCVSTGMSITCGSGRAG